MVDVIREIVSHNLFASDTLPPNRNLFASLTMADCDRIPSKPTMPFVIFVRPTHHFSPISISAFPPPDGIDQLADLILNRFIEDVIECDDL